MAVFYFYGYRTTHKDTHSIKKSYMPHPLPNTKFETAKNYKISPEWIAIRNVETIRIS